MLIAASLLIGSALSANKKPYVFLFWWMLCCGMEPPMSRGRLVDLHYAELLPPAVEGLPSYLLLAADVQDRLVGFFRLAQNADLLFCGIPSASHYMGPF
jgi:hypothetical protein